VQQDLIAQISEEQTIKAAATVLNETMGTPLNRIPQAMLSNSHGVAIFPNVIKGGFIIGARRGRGVLFIRGENGVWDAPVFITMTGGNIGWQVGVQSSDIILVFKTPKSVQGVLSGKLAIGADAAAAAGPIGRQGSVATDGKLQAEIYTYSRSRGLFAGVAIDGSVLSVDQVATSNYYRPAIPGQPTSLPLSAQHLTQLIAAYVGSPIPVHGLPVSNVSQQHELNESDLFRSQLQQVAPKLFQILDEPWRDYLSLPNDIFTGQQHPTSEALQAALVHYRVVDESPQWQSLANRPEFQSVFGLLGQYYQAISAVEVSLQLPPPPAFTRPVLPR
jgi:lipid-binding SYLF domain-containing protein